MTAASSTGRPVGGATHVLTSPWQPLSSPCPPCHTHTEQSHSSTPTQPQDTHTHACVRAEFLGLHPVQDKLNPHAPPAIFENSIHGSSLFQSTLGEVCSNNFAFSPPSQSHCGEKKKLCRTVLMCVTGRWKEYHSWTGHKWPPVTVFILLNLRGGPVTEADSTYLRALPVCRHLFRAALFCVNMTARCWNVYIVLPTLLPVTQMNDRRVNGGALRIKNK